VVSTALDGGSSEANGGLSGLQTGKRRESAASCDRADARGNSN